MGQSSHEKNSLSLWQRHWQLMGTLLLHVILYRTKHVLSEHFFCIAIQSISLHEIANFLLSFLRMINY